MNELTKTIIKSGLIVEVNNFRYATIVVVKSNTHKREYRKEHFKRMCSKTFLNFVNKLEQIDFKDNLQQLFSFLDNMNYQVVQNE